MLQKLFGFWKISLFLNVISVNRLYFCPGCFLSNLMLEEQLYKPHNNILLSIKVHQYPSNNIPGYVMKISFIFSWSRSKRFCQISFQQQCFDTSFSTLCPCGEWSIQTVYSFLVLSLYLP